MSHKAPAWFQTVPLLPELLYMVRVPPCQLTVPELVRGPAKEILANKFNTPLLVTFTVAELPKLPPDQLNKPPELTCNTPLTVALPFNAPPASTVICPLN